MSDESNGAVSGPLGEKLIEVVAKFRLRLPGRESLGRLRLTGPVGIGLTQPWQVLAVAVAASSNYSSVIPARAQPYVLGAAAIATVWINRSGVPV